MRQKTHKEIRPSILDRLIDNNLHLSAEHNRSSSQHIKELRNSVKRDLENLLNTRYRMKSAPEHHKHLEKSLLNYGLPDLATVNISDIEKKRAFVKSLEATLALYEPRFKTIRVHYIENKTSTDRSLRFRIDATLYADPAPEVIVFDSILDPIFRTVKVEESNHV